MNERNDPNRDRELLDDSDVRDEDLVETETGEIEIDKEKEHTRSQTGAGE